MARKLEHKTLDEVIQEMSIAGNKEAVKQIIEELLEMIVLKLNVKSIPDLENMQYGLQRVIAELRVWERRERRRQHG